MDIVKTFDNIVNRKIFLQVLPSFEINNYRLKWFENQVLFYKKHMVRINDVTSQESIIEYEVSRGRVVWSYFVHTILY